MTDERSSESCKQTSNPNWERMYYDLVYNRPHDRHFELVKATLTATAGDVAFDHTQPEQLAKNAIRIADAVMKELQP